MNRMAHLTGQGVVALAVFVMSAALCLVAGAGLAAGSGLVVFEAPGGKFAPGDTVDGTVPLALEVGQTLTLIAEDGSVIKLRGPYNGVPRSASAATAGPLSAALAQLIAVPASTSSALGASRDAAAGTGPGGGVAKPAKVVGTIGGVIAVEGGASDPWLIDVSGPGHRCILDAGELVFWRPDRNAVADVTLTIDTEGWKGYTGWPAGFAKLAAPEAMPRRDGAIYTVDYGRGPAGLTIHVLPAKVSGVPVLAAWMVEKGCVEQAAALLRSRS
ncbi:MAG: hypothetical protein WCF85_02750 [Rhodospirillaceae bacterium]